MVMAPAPAALTATNTALAPAVAAAAAAPAPLVAVDGSEDAIERLLDQITALKAEHKRLEQQLEPLLESLSAAMASGQLDPAFSHNDWSFSHSAGRRSYSYPAAVEQIERQLKAAKEAAIQQASATEKPGKPFWTIRPPSAPALPF
jgi:phage shock protein A